MCEFMESIFPTDPLPVFVRGEPERRERSEAAVGSSGVEPLEDGPEQAPQARPDDERHLPPVISRNVCSNIYPSAPRIRQERHHQATNSCAIATHFACMTPWGLWKLLMRCAVAEPLGNVSRWRMIMVCSPVGSDDGGTWRQDTVITSSDGWWSVRAYVPSSWAR